MSLCSNCGKENREGARFCQACGTPFSGAEPPKKQGPILEGKPSPLPRKSSQEIALGPTCTSCGTLNAPGMKFCKMCGSPLDTPQGQPAKVICPSCGGQTPGGYKFCQHCGTPLARGGAPAAPAAREAPPAPVLGNRSPLPAVTGVIPPSASSVIPAAAPPSGTVGLGIRPMAATGKASPVAQSPNTARTVIDLDSGGAGPLASAPSKVGLVKAPTSVGPLAAGKSPNVPSAAVEQPRRGVPTGLQPKAAGQVTVGPGGPRPSAAVHSGTENIPVARLISVNRDGTDGQMYPLTEEAVDLGRTQGQLLFADDPYLSERHCRFFVQHGKWWVQDLTSLNGLFLRLRQPWELQHNDLILLGKQVLVFEWLSEHERGMTPAVEHGVLVFGSPVRSPWGRLRQFTVAGIYRDVYYLYRLQTRIGREDGDLLFSDDEFMSRQHLTLSLMGKIAVLEDLGSSNGTYVRIRNQHEFTTGDMVRIGDQLFRFDMG
jgi:pSer/pThr/pTyr-binding forkhead associated (FHA) protein